MIPTQGTSAYNITSPNSEINKRTLLNFEFDLYHKDQFDFRSPIPPPQIKKYGGAHGTPGAQSKTTQQYSTMPYNPTTVVNTKMGSIIKDSIINGTPFTGKELLTTLLNGTEKFLVASMWYTRRPDKSKFQRDFDEKLQKRIGVIYGDFTTNT